MVREFASRDEARHHIYARYGPVVQLARIHSISLLPTIAEASGSFTIALLFGRGIVILPTITGICHRSSTST